jgi:hypothetical protein
MAEESGSLGPMSCRVVEFVFGGVSSGQACRRDVADPGREAWGEVDRPRLR